MKNVILFEGNLYPLSWDDIKAMKDSNGHPVYPKCLTKGYYCKSLTGRFSVIIPPVV
jgi:hypothetical protein